ncbi:MAG: 3-hydroxyacyl-CoA dehydrogenase family protein [Ginsengibacter sp.]
MKVIVVANVDQREEIISKNTNPLADLVFLKSFSDHREIHENYDALFVLSGDIDFSDRKLHNGKPVFINSVIETLEQKKAPLNVSRINGWPGFLKRQTWEVASHHKIIAGKIFEAMDWAAVFVKDEPGMIAARVISMIINEAFFALEEGVSTIEEIDLAMKLGTNYPYGPFEWQQKIGLQNIYRLLQNLSVKDKRYLIAPLLEKKYFELTSSQIN